jgi:hypothetical protein
VDVRSALTGERTNEEQRSMKMTAKQWAARAVMAAAMATGLGACGGGGDSAAPAVAPTPEELTAGLTVKESSDSAFSTFEYKTLKALATDGAFDTSTESTIFAQNNEAGNIDHIELTATYLKSTGQILKVVLLKNPALQTWHAVGCGFDSFACDNSKIKQSASTKELRVSSLQLKSLSFSPTIPSASIISDAGTHLSSTPGLALVSGVVSLP